MPTTALGMREVHIKRVTPKDVCTRIMVILRARNNFIILDLPMKFHEYFR